MVFHDLRREEAEPQDPGEAGPPDARLDGKLRHRPAPVVQHHFVEALRLAQKSEQTAIRGFSGAAVRALRARGLRMKNDEAEGLLLPAHEVSARISQVGVAFQRGQAAARRSIEAVCCDKCRGPVVAEHEAATNATIAAVRGALEGK